jgi:hypothetical protein
MSMGFLPKPKRRRVGVALTFSYISRAVLLDVSKVSLLCSLAAGPRAQSLRCFAKWHNDISLDTCKPATRMFAYFRWIRCEGMEALSAGGGSTFEILWESSEK